MANFLPPIKFVHKTSISRTNFHPIRNFVHQMYLSSTKKGNPDGLPFLLLCDILLSLLFCRSGLNHSLVILH